MKKSNSKTSVKMVLISGLLVREDQVAGRLRALAHGRALKAMLAADQKEEEKQLADKGFSPEEIACLRHSNRIKTMESMGLGTSARVRRMSF